MELVVRENATGRVVAQIPLHSTGSVSSFESIMAHTSARVEPQDAIHETHDSLPIAGRIDAPADSFASHVDGWCVRMARVQGLGPKTIRSYREGVEQFSRFNGWSKPADVTTEAIEAYITEKRSSGEWAKGTTANRELCAVRSFCRYLVSRKLLPVDPTEEVARAKDDGDEGSRAARRDEAIAMIRLAYVREMAMGYKKSARWLQHLMRYHAGLRDGEAAKLEWRRHIFLDAEIPHIHWTKDINKNRRVMKIALHPELVTLLREHQEAMRYMARTMPEVIVRNRRNHNEGPVKKRQVNPDQAGSFVFPWASTAFESDADRVGIVRTDDRGRRFSSHSARKYFATELARAGVEIRMIDYLMRHRGGTELRYFDPDLAWQLASVSKLAPLSPEVIHNPSTTKMCDLTKPGADGHDVNVESAVSIQPTRSKARPSRSRRSRQDFQGDGARLLDELRRCGAAPGGPEPSESNLLSNPEMPIGPFDNSPRFKALSSLLVSLAALIEGEDGRSSGRGKAG